MRQRPIACLALIMFLVLTLLPAGLFYNVKPRQITGKCKGLVTGLVDRRTYRDGNTQLELTDCRIQSGETHICEKRLLVYLTGAADYPAGTHLSLSGTIYPTEEAANPGQFDARLYYAGRGISYTMYAESASVTGKKAAPVREGLQRIRERLGAIYDAVFEERESGLMRAMLLGEKTGLDAEMKELYQRNGISHLLAISGLHISLVGLGFYKLLKKLTGFWPLSGILAGILSALFVAAYGWMTGASVSAVRAAAMCILMILADILGRTYDMLNAAGVVALAMMCINPLCVKQSAFLLSFGAVFGIGLISPLWRLYKPRQGKLLQSLGAGLSVLLVTFPLLLRFFYEYPLYSTFLNLLVIPLMSVLMAAGILCGLVGLFSLNAARLFAIPCGLILRFYEWLGKSCLSLPGAVLPVGRPAFWKPALYYGVLFLSIFVLYREKRRKKYWRGREEFQPKRRLPVVCGAFLGLSACILCLRVSAGLTITMLDVGQGDGIFFRDSRGTTYLCDAGSSSVSGVGEYRVLPFLKAEGVTRIDYLMISHMDADHINGVQELLMKDLPEEGAEADIDGGRSGVEIGHAVLPALAVKDEAYLAMEELLEKADVTILYMGAGDRLVGEEISLTCLWPEKGTASSDRNEQSLVILAEYGEFQMLFTGDIGEHTEARIAASGMLEPVEILKTAHHGSKYSSSASFLAKARPFVSLISCSPSNRYGHPGEDTLKRLDDAGSRVFITKDCGAIRVWTDGHRVRVRGYKREKE